MSEDDPESEESADDPFERLEGPSEDPFAAIDEDEREADPFERLADERRDELSSPRDASTEPGQDDMETDPEQTESNDYLDGQSLGADESKADPFDGLGRDDRTGDPFTGLDDAEAGSGRPDEDLWEDLSREAAEPETETHGQRRYAEVSKHRYCERCEYFSEPPDVACSHEGTDIIEFVDTETVRLADCPIVAEREELADLETEQ